MATLHFELVSPEKLVFSGEVEQVDVPGAEGDFGVLAGHAPMVTTLRPGVTVLADTANSLPDFDRAVLAAQIGEMEQRVAKMEPGNELDKLITRLDHYRNVDRHLSGTAMH